MPTTSTSLSTSSETAADVYCNHGYLVFKSKEVFDGILKSVSEMQGNQKDQWEQQFSGFHSMRFVFNQIVVEEMKVANKYNVLTAAQIAILSGQGLIVEHSKMAMQNQRMLITVQMGDGGYYDKNISREDLSFIVNKDGIVEINHVIYQITKNKLKAIEDGSDIKISKLINADVSDASIGIYVADGNFGQAINLANVKRTAGTSGVGCTPCELTYTK
jgi:hypothetical protein